MTQSNRGRPQLSDHLFVLSAWVIACLVLFVSLGAAPRLVNKTKQAITQAPKTNR